MTIRLDDDSRRLLDAPNFAYLSTLMEDGSPKVEPVWIGRDGDRVFITTDRKSLKAINIARDARVALAVTNFNNPYEQLLIRGRVAETRADDDMKGMDALSQKYLGKPFARRKWSARVIYFIEPSLARYYKSPLEHTPPPT